MSAFQLATMLTDDALESVLQRLDARSRLLFSRTCRTFAVCAPPFPQTLHVQVRARRPRIENELYRFQYEGRILMFGNPNVVKDSICEGLWPASLDWDGPEDAE